MFLQINLPERDTHLHRYLWRNLDPTKEPIVYRLLRVTFGDKPSPDMARFVMLRIAKEHSDDLPEVSISLERDRYVDIIHSCSTPESAVERIKGIETALRDGSFHIKKWFMSSEEARHQLKSVEAPVSGHKVNYGEGSTKERISQSSESQDCEQKVNLDQQDGVKTLGLDWSPEEDVLKFVVKPAQLSHPTKRNILSRMPMLYHPLRLASCVTIRARVAMQDIWGSKFDWDDSLPPETCDLWNGLLTEIENLKTVEFSRCLKPIDTQGASYLHAFSDSSMTAYGAMAYLMWRTPEGPKVNLVSAKARVAALRQTTIPRLELMGALAASRLAKIVFDECKEKPETVTLWTDSQIVLQWLRAESVTMKAFVGLRVAEIQSTWDPTNRRFVVPTNLNPADDLSRGLTVAQLNDRWIYGPSFLKEPAEPSQPAKGIWSSRIRNLSQSPSNQFPSLMQEDAPTGNICSESPDTA